MWMSPPRDIRWDSLAVQNLPILLERLLETKFILGMFCHFVVIYKNIMNSSGIPTMHCLGLAPNKCSLKGHKASQ